MCQILTTPKFVERNQRSKWLYKQYNHIFTGETLDVGCFEAPLRHILGESHYKGIDFIGNPDYALI